MMYSKRNLPDVEQWSNSGGSNVIPRQARPSLAVLRAHMGVGLVVWDVGSACPCEMLMLATECKTWDMVRWGQLSRVLFRVLRYVDRVGGCSEATHGCYTMDYRGTSLMRKRNPLRT